MTIEIITTPQMDKEKAAAMTKAQIEQRLVVSRGMLETTLKTITQLILANPYGLTKEEVRESIPYIEALDSLAVDIMVLLSKVNVRSEVNPVENSAE